MVTPRRLQLKSRSFESKLLTWNISILSTPSFGKARRIIEWMTVPQLFAKFVVHLEDDHAVQWDDVIAGVNETIANFEDTVFSLSNQRFQPDDYHGAMPAAWRETFENSNRTWNFFFRRRWWWCRSLRWKVRRSSWWLLVGS
jgi:hypothetical protein